jgi:hypothetical protein
MGEFMNPKPFNVAAHGSLGAPDTRYRVYPAPGGLFFVVVEHDSRTALTLIFGLIYSVLIAKVVEFFNRSKRQKRIEELDATGTLRERMETSRYNFRVAHDEIVDSCIRKVFLGFDPRYGGVRAKWEILYSEGCKYHRRDLFFTSNVALAAALPVVESTLGDRHQTLVEWNEAKRKFVKNNVERRRLLGPANPTETVDERIRA